MSAQAHGPAADRAIDMDWLESNRRHLLAALAEVRLSLERYVSLAGESDPALGQGGIVREPQAFNHQGPSAPPALETLCAIFHLSPFERQVLLLCAGVELDSRFASLCASAHTATQGDGARPYATFSLALSALSEPHWSALTPAAPLRRWRLIEVTGGPASLTSSPLRIDERVLHYLAGIQHADERLAGLVHAVRSSEELVPSHRRLAERITALWTETPEQSIPIIQLNGSEILSKEAIASDAAESMGLSLGKVSAHALPTSPGELEAFTRLCEREAILARSVIYLDCHELDPSDSPRSNAAARFIEGFKGGLIIASRERMSERLRPVVSLDVNKPETAEQIDLWQSALKTAGGRSKRSVKKLTSQFNLSQSTIRSAAIEAMSLAPARRSGGRGQAGAFEAAVWDICRAHTRPRLDDLAQRIEPRAAWEDLVLPEAQKEALSDIALHVRNRATVYDDWGFAARSPRGLGITALFAGASGTGKTMAAEVVAAELRLDLYRIDLSSVVSKYIGETEKNLRRVFDAADEGGAILLFDEADALFGKRSEVKDSHDRYANIEVGYLLQRMEAYKGLAILTTNFKEAMDAAFLRRIRFLVQFPFPDAARRAEIWRRIFPSGTPTEGLDPVKLARINVTGGSIRNIALNAAFFASEEGEPVRMKHLLRAARSEYAKLERPLSDSEVGGWV
ncbi:MAG TPA: AAA family ATPase [Blastocatellia bacterium]|nr:AAA family ATPase [Blastocatellia bacterium]